MDAMVKSASLALSVTKPWPWPRAVGSGSPLPKGKPNLPIAQQIPSADTEDGALQLLNTFGVRTLYDENGDLVLVSFNQATPVNDSTDAELSAKRRAGTFAQGEIRKFLGEQIALADDVVRSESVKDYEDNTRATEAIEGGIHHFDALAETISITGIASVSDWVARHPVTGHIIVGSVQTWSPSGRDFAGMLRGKIAKAAAAAASGEQPALTELELVAVSQSTPTKRASPAAKVLEGIGAGSDSPRPECAKAFDRHSWFAHRCGAFQRVWCPGSQCPDPRHFQWQVHRLYEHLWNLVRFR